MSRRTYVFLNGKSDGNKDMKLLLGGKGANLCEMSKRGLNVPPGVTITTDVCQEFYRCGARLPDGLMEEVIANVRLIEQSMGQKFADNTAAEPLLLSVRSGAALSMPGMMDTVLNLGLNDVLVETMAAGPRGERFAFDCYRRLLAMYGDVVLGLPKDEFEEPLTNMKKARSVKFDIELSGPDLRQIVKEFKQVYTKHGKSLPQDAWEQLRTGVDAVFRSWNIPRAIRYREINKVDTKVVRGTAVNIQAMVYGNVNNNSCTGVLFTRNPANGTKELFGEFLPNAQGEDVVAGIRTPFPISQLKELMPAVYQELLTITTNLEAHMKDMQDVEFTVQDGRLFMLQCRNGKRTGLAALRIAADMQREGLVTKEEAICMVEPRHLDQLLHPTFKDEKAYAKLVVARGLPASPGAGVGRLVFTAEEAEAWFARGEQVILCRTETSPEDVGGMHAASGILTSRGGMTSHAAVVARGWGKPCVCGCEVLHVDEHKKKVDIENHETNTIMTLVEGDWVSINGTTGEVIKGQQELRKPEIAGDLALLMSWVDETRRLRVLANADTGEDCRVARANGAEGLGLCRTEHMFFSTQQRIFCMRRMIAATELGGTGNNKLHENEEHIKAEALEELKGYQRTDFEAIFEAMDGLPVTIRLLDPPLHEFLPHEGPALTNLCQTLATELKCTPEAIKGRLENLRECNPMMGLRGCRLGIVHPEISEMQAYAIFEAASNVAKRGGKVHPHIMIPLVGMMEELDGQINLVRRVATEVAAKSGVTVPYKVGSMIEVPRGALKANELARTAEFFSFGTNDLTQMTLGISRDDAEAKFLQFYMKNGILSTDPFDTLDVEGVGELVQIAVERGRSTNPNIELGICGEHGGDPNSIAFFEKVGLDYVSCSPLRVPIARLAAAQAAVKARKSAAPPAGVAASKLGGTAQVPVAPADADGAARVVIGAR